MKMTVYSEFHVCLPQAKALRLCVTTFSHSITVEYDIFYKGNWILY